MVKYSESRMPVSSGSWSSAIRRILLTVGAVLFLGLGYIVYELADDTTLIFLIKGLRGQPVTCLDLPRDEWKNFEKCTRPSQRRRAAADADTV